MSRARKTEPRSFLEFLIQERAKARLRRERAVREDLRLHALGIQDSDAINERYVSAARHDLLDGLVIMFQSYKRKGKV